MAEFTIAKSVEELEERYNLKRGEAKRFPISKENMPEKLWVLLPYLDYFAIDAQEDREKFYKMLPPQAFDDLDNTLDALEPDLSDWINSQSSKKPYSNEYLALLILTSDTEEYGTKQAPKKLTDNQRLRVEFLIKLDEKALREQWNLPLDGYTRIEFDPDKLPDYLQSIKHIVKIVALADWKEIKPFARQLPESVLSDIHAIQRYFATEINQYCVVSRIRKVGEKRPPELLAVDMLSIFYE